MVRVKAIAKRNSLSKKSKKSKSYFGWIVFPPNESNEKYYLGEIEIGKTNNVLPVEWLRCKVCLTGSADLNCLQLEFDKNLTTLVEVHSDFLFIKGSLYLQRSQVLIYSKRQPTGIFSSRIFAVRFNTSVEGIVKVKLYLVTLPLEKFDKTIAGVIKQLFANLFNIQANEDEEEIEKNVSKTKCINQVYKLFKPFQTKCNDVAKPIEHSYLKPTLRSYQEDAVRWMITREQKPEIKEMLHPLYEKIVLDSGDTLYFDKYTGSIDNVEPLVPNLSTGGILADEMGLGKTVEVLACILCNPKHSDSLDATADKFDNDDVTPTILRHSKKRSRPLVIFDSEDNCIELKNLNECNEQPSKKRKKMLHEIFSDHQEAIPALNAVQCVCGRVNTDGSVECNKCSVLQHAFCLGYDESLGEYICPKCWSNEPLLESSATLIITPISLQSQWCQEICKHVSADFKILVYEGSQAHPIYPTQFNKYDLVLTTYSILESELRLSQFQQRTVNRRTPRYTSQGSSIARIKWWRLCLDEAQTVEIPHSMISTMSKKLFAHNRWAITGTPMSRDVLDLYGLIDYLLLEPYNESATFYHYLYLPYVLGNEEPMLKFLAQVMWRSSKDEVYQQINIPPKTIHEYSLEFSSVEQYYYQREHELCSRLFLKALGSFDSDVILSELHKSEFKRLMTPLLTLRQACAHPGAVRGRYFNRKCLVNSMEGLLNALIEQNRSDSEEYLRLVVSAINGTAGINLLLKDTESALVAYRKVIKLAERFNKKESSRGLNVDVLQHIHAIHNLSEFLSVCPNADSDLSVDSLKTECLRLEEDHLERYLAQNLAAYKDGVEAMEMVARLEGKLITRPEDWYITMLDWISENDLMNDLYLRIHNVLENSNCNMLKLSNEGRLLYLVSTWHTEITKLRAKSIKKLNEMYTYSDENTGKILISDKIIEAAVDCHLRPQKGVPKSKKCIVCTVSEVMRSYEANLFNMMSAKKSEASEDISNKGSWKPTTEELILQAILKICGSKNIEQEIYQDGKTFFNILGAYKREFKRLRKFWTHLDQLICTYDEIKMCKIRLCLKENDANGSPRKKSKIDNILKQLSPVLENDIEARFLLEGHELPYQMSILHNEEQLNMAKLEKNLGTQNYLESLKKEQLSTEKLDPCPICQHKLEGSWSIIPCGHSYCLDCIHHVIEKYAVGGRIMCSVCRATHKAKDVSYTRLGEVKATKSIVKGDHSTKIEAVVKLVMTLKNADKNVKILIFSTWEAILKVLRSACQANDIEAKAMLLSNFQGCLQSFKDLRQNITVLLLPVRLGSKGLNLIEATHVVFVEPLLNPADEAQAIGRIHRIGQTKPVHIHKFIIKDTIEESIHGAISANADNWDSNIVTIGQLRNLFSESTTETLVEETHNEDLVVSESTGIISNSVESSDEEKDETTSGIQPQQSHQQE